MDIRSEPGALRRGRREDPMTDEVLEIVLVEEDPDFAELYRQRLELDGYLVRVAATGRAGLEAIKENPPDLVYLDVRLPELDGLEVLEQLRADPAMATLPVVVLSNYEEPELRQRGIALGVLEWLVKADVTPSRLGQHTIEFILGAAEVERRELWASRKPHVGGR